MPIVRLLLVIIGMAAVLSQGWKVATLVYKHDGFDTAAMTFIMFLVFAMEVPGIVIRWMPFE